MQPIEKIRILICALVALSQAWVVGAETSFRTPARLYAGAYSIKIQLKKGLVEYDIPVWIKPDQTVSTLDPVLLRELGYQEKTPAFDFMKIGGQKLKVPRFEFKKSEWAFVPDFHKSCCHGVIGMDVLSLYEIRFDPRPSVHLEWKKLEKELTHSKSDLKFEKNLKSLFSLKTVSELPVILNLLERKIEFEGSPREKQSPVFQFWFVPPDREIRVTTVSKLYLESARKSGFRNGETLTHINGESVTKLDRWEIEEMLSGSRGMALEFTNQMGKKFRFDFQRGGFLPL